MPWDQPRLTNLRSLLAELYPREMDQRRLVTDAGLRQAAIAFDASADNSWFAVLQHANHQGRVDALLDLARTEYPDNELLGRARDERPPALLHGPDIKSSVAWRGPPNTRALQEKILGTTSALVPVSYLALGLRRARSVARVVLADGSSGTGFLTAKDILVTNHHVLPDRARAAAAKAQFNYQKTAEGLDERAEELALLPGEVFITSAADDFTAVRVAGGPGSRWGALALEPRSIQKDDRVNIVQHPGGGFKQLSFFANFVVFAGGGRVQYLTDTLPGSSGAPVFDREWNVVALHHSGGWLVEPGGDSRQRFYRNEGISTEVILAGLADLFS